MIKKIFFLLSVLFVVTTSTVAANTPPQILNFRIEASQPDRIYFDSTKPITGSSADGFDLKDHGGIRITGVSINANQSTGHYFTVSSSFKWYHNNTFNYSGGSDIQSEEGLVLDEFNLHYIENSISVPDPSGKEYYVNLDGDNFNNGQSEESAFRTIQKGVNTLSPGDKLWIKAGDYGDENVIIYTGGTETSPIQIEGYKEYIGDITSPYYEYGNFNGTINGSNPFLANEMPLLDADNQTQGKVAITISEGRSFIIIRNIQAQNYEKGYLLNYNSSQIVFENVLGKDMGGKNTYGSVFKLDGYRQKNDYLRLIDCVAINGSEENIAFQGDNVLLENCKSYCDRGNVEGNIGLPTDYYIFIRGKYNIIRESLVNRISKGHGGHGFALKYENENTLIENSKAINMEWGFQARHSVSHHNVFRDCEAHADVPYRISGGSGVYTGAINVTNGSHHNIFENFYIHDIDGVFTLDRSSEDNANSSDIGNNNLFKNIIADNIRITAFNMRNWEPRTASFSNNKFYNITFNNIQGYLFRINQYSGNVSMANNEMVNCIFNDINTLNIISGSYRKLKDSEFNWDSNSFNNSFPSKGSNYIEANPNFINSSSGDFRLQSDSECIDAGITLEEVTTDFDNLPRTQGNQYDIGAFEFQSEANEDVYAGEDVAICNGSSVTLTASGLGSEFLWSNEETTQSITVSPTETTTYTVTLTNEGSSTTDSVVVTVNEAPTADAGSDVSICLGSEIILTALGGDFYTWSTGETTQSITISPTETTTYTVTTTNDGCTDTAEDNVLVTVNSSLNIDAGEDVEICIGNSIELTATDAENYLWSTGETTQSITVNPEETTLYTVSTSGDGCTIEDSVEVIVNSIPVVNAGDDMFICEGNSVVLTASGNGDFIWSTGETTARIVVSPTTTTTYTVSSSSTCGDEVSDDVIVTVSLMPDLDAGIDTEICSGDSVTLTATGADNYEWSTGETTESITVNPTLTTTYTVTSSNGECSISDEVKVKVNDLAEVNAGNDVWICRGEEIVLIAKGSGDFVWSTGETTRRITVNPDITTTYTVTSNSTCGNGVSDDVIVTVNELPSVHAGEDVTVVSGTSISLTATGEGSFLWNTGETTQSITVSPTKTTKYRVSITSNGGCTSDDEVIVTVTYKQVVANAGEDVEICKNTNVTLTASGGNSYLWNTGATTKEITVSPNHTSTYSVKVSNETSSDTDEVIVSVTNLPAINAGDDVVISGGSTVTLTAIGDGNFLWSTGETSQSINVNPTTTTAYTVSTTSSKGCSNEDEVVVTVESTQVVANAGEDVEICKDSNIILTASGGENYLWSTGESTQSITVNPSETTTYSVTVSNAFSLDSDDVIVTVDQGCSGISNRLILKKALVYPNPTHGILNVQMKGYSDDIKISIFNLNGNLLFSKTISNYSSDKKLNQKLDLSQYRKGVYFVRIENRQDVQTKKIMVY